MVAEIERYRPVRTPHRAPPAERHPVVSVRPDDAGGIAVRAWVGRGRPDDPWRIVEQIWSLTGVLLEVRDLWRDGRPAGA